MSDITYEELTLAATVIFLKISLASDITYEELTPASSGRRESLPIHEPSGCRTLPMRN